MAGRGASWSLQHAHGRWTKLRRGPVCQPGRSQAACPLEVPQAVAAHPGVDMVPSQARGTTFRSWCSHKYSQKHPVYNNYTVTIVPCTSIPRPSSRGLSHSAPSAALAVSPPLLRRRMAWREPLETTLGASSHHGRGLNSTLWPQISNLATV